MNAFFPPKLFLRNSARRTSSCTRTTFDACICINFKFTITLTDCSDWALTFACPATNTSVTNYKCHDCILLNCYTFRLIFNYQTCLHSNTFMLLLQDKYYEFCNSWRRFLIPLRITCFLSRTLSLSMAGTPFNL